MKSLDARLNLLEKAAPPEWHITVTITPEGSPRDDSPREPGVHYVRITPHADSHPPPADLPT